MALRWIALVKPKPFTPPVPIIATIFGEHATQVLRSAPIDDPRQTRFVVVDTNNDDHVLLHGFNCFGHEIWDSWHETIPEAKRQAEFSYGDHLGSWSLVPAGVSNTAVYGCEMIAAAAVG